MPPLILTAQFDATVQTRLNEIRTRFFPSERNYLDAHLTLFHALPEKLLKEIKNALTEATQVEPPEAWLKNLFPLGKGFAIEVVAPRLKTLRENLARHFASELTRQDASGFRPHVTLQNKVDPKQAKADMRLARQFFFSDHTHIAALALWAYEGGPWRLLQTFAFSTPNKIDFGGRTSAEEQNTSPAL